MTQQKYHLRDIPIKEVIAYQHLWSQLNRNGYEAEEFTYQILGRKYGSEKLVFRRMQQLANWGLLDYGVSLRTAWVTEKGLAILYEPGETRIELS